MFPDQNDQQSQAYRNLESQTGEENDKYEYEPKGKKPIPSDAIMGIIQAQGNPWIHLALAISIDWILTSPKSFPDPGCTSPSGSGDDIPDPQQDLEEQIDLLRKMHIICFVLLYGSTLITDLIWSHNWVIFNVISLVFYTYRILQSTDYILQLREDVVFCQDLQLGNSEQWLKLEISAYWINILVTLLYLTQFIFFGKENHMGNAKKVYLEIMERHEKFV